MTTRKPRLTVTQRNEARLAAHGELTGIIAAHLTADRSSVPCVQPDQWRDWTSDSARNLNKAAKACRTCPALQACRDYAAQWERNGAGVWAGKTRGRTITEQTQLDLGRNTQ